MILAKIILFSCIWIIIHGVPIRITRFIIAFCINATNTSMRINTQSSNTFINGIFIYYSIIIQNKHSFTIILLHCYFYADVISCCKASIFSTFN